MNNHRMNNLFFTLSLMLITLGISGCGGAAADEAPSLATTSPSIARVEPIATFTPLSGQEGALAAPQQPGAGTPSGPLALGETTNAAQPLDPAASGEAASTESASSPTPTSTQAPTTAVVATTVATSGGAAAVTANADLILHFGISPQTVDPGGRVEFAWHTSADSVMICPRTYLGLIDHLCLIGLEPSGNRIIYTEPLSWDYTGYQITAYKGTNKVDTMTLPISVTPQNTWKYWFVTDPPYTTNVPTQNPVTIPYNSVGTLQRFQNGIMLWLNEPFGQVLVITNDGRYQRIISLPNATTSGMTAPTGLFVPAGGFGAIWAGSENIRTALGYATEGEQNHTASYQCYAENGALSCFTRGADNAVFLLKPDGTWILWA